MAKQLSSFQPQPNSTKLYMPLNGNSVDISGNGNHGTDTAITYVGGKFGQGARLIKASSSIINIGTSSILSGTEDKTVSCWVKANSFSVNGNTAVTIGGQTNNNQLSLGFTSSGLPNAYLYGGFGQAIGSVLSTEKWYHLLAVYKTSGILLYVNGILNATGSANSMNISGTNGNFLGNYTNYDANYGFDGIIDEVIIESRAWTAQEISTYYRKSVLNYRTKSYSFMAMLGIAYNTTINSLAFTTTVNNLNTTKSFLISIANTAYTSVANNINFGRIMNFTINTLSYLVTLLPENIRTNTWRNPDNKSSTTYTNPDNKSSTTYTNPDNKSSTTWTNRNKNI